MTVGCGEFGCRTLAVFKGAGFDFSPRIFAFEASGASPIGESYGEKEIGDRYGP